MKRLITTALALAALLSCAEDDNITTNYELVEASFSAATITTRAEAERWPDGAEVGIYMNSAYTSENKQYEVSTTGALTAKTDADKIYYPISSEADFYAYYPYSATAMVDGTYTYSGGGEDLMFASATGMSSGNNVALAFTRALAKIKLTISFNTYEITVGDNPTSCSLSGVYPSATWSYTGGLPTTTGTAAAASFTTDLTDIANGTFTAELTIVPQELASSKITITVGGNSYTTSNLDEILNDAGMVSNYDLILSGTTATVTTSSITEWGSGSSGSLGYDGKQTGSGIEADPYLLYTAGDLAKIATYNAADVYFKLMEDIDLGGTSSGQNLIGDNNFTFYGNLDGNDMTISGLSLTGSSSNTAIFANSSGTIENLRVADCTISSSSNYTAAIVASNSGKITNCHVSGTISSDSNYTAAITGYSSGGSISDCTVSASVGGESNYTGGIAGRISGGSISSCHASGEVNGTYTVGGVVGYVSSSCAISDCSATGSVTGSNSSVGGVAGTIDNSSSATKCTASGKVSGTECVGGVVGKLYQECTVTDCSATGSVTGSSSSVGGVVGWVQYKCSISGSSASGKVSGTEYVGGVVGYNVYKTSDDDISTITGCYATGDVGGTSYVGGVVGMNEGHVTECYYTTGTVTGTTTSIGGVAGQNGNSTYHGVLYRCYNSGSVSGKGMVGGVVGYQPEGETMSCYNLGDITNTATSNTALTGNNTGGVVGHCDAYTYVIGGCSGGSVTASDTSGCGCIGGIAGSSNSGTELIGCYSTAELILLSGVTQNMTTSVQYFNSSNCSGISVGGVVGYLHLTGFRYSIIDDSYWLTNTRTSRVYAICMSSSTLSPDTTITDSKAKSAGELNSETLALTLNTALTSIVPGAYDDPTTITAFANSPLSYATSSAGDSSYPYLKLITND